MKGLDVETLMVSHIQVNQAMKQRRRTYRAHGRINRALPAAPAAIPAWGLAAGPLLSRAPPPQRTCRPRATWSLSCRRRLRP